MYDILFQSVTVVSCDAENRVFPNAYLGVKDGKIAWLDTKAPEEGAYRVINGENKVLMPGLINAHTHIPMVLMRGMSDDTDLQDWLFNHIFPTEDRLDDVIVRVGTRLALCEFLANGITSFSDSYFFCDAIADAVHESGIKANIARSVTNFDQIIDFDTFYSTKEAVELHQKWHGADNGRIRIDASIHAEYTTSESLWNSLGAYARENELVMQLHLSETEKEHRECVEKYGKTPSRVFYDAGVFDAKTLAAHCVHVTDEDMDILAEKGVSVAHNPVSNLKLASGVARVPELLKKGVNVALGTDGVASNNNADLFEEIKLCACLHKGISGDPRCIDAAQTLRIATAHGAIAQGREHECGIVALGMDADLILLDFDRPHLKPCHNVTSNLVYSARGSDVCMTMVRGKVLYENGAFLTLDYERILREFESDGMGRPFS